MKSPEVKNEKVPEEKKSKKKEVELKHKVKEETAPVVPSIGDTFESLRAHVSPKTMEGIESFGFSTLTDVQKESIPLLLARIDVWGTARAGSGKTLAFLIPAVELIKECEGLSCVVLSPTRELIMQTSSVLEKLALPHGLQQTTFIGGTKINAERQAWRSGVNILLATPGRLVDHIKHTGDFLLSSVKVLIVDEADRMMDNRFEEDMKIIMRHIKGKRKTPFVTMLFSATKSDRLERLSSAILRENHKVVNLTKPSVQKLGSSSGSTKSTAESADDADKKSGEKLTHTYLECCTFQRFLVLYKILSENKDKKMMVFINTCDGVNFYKKLLGCLGLSVMGIQGRQGQQIRYKNYQEFAAAESGALLCTDVAARGWDIPAVDLIVQFDPPQSIQEYIHRVGRAARRLGETGEAVLFVRKEELPILAELQKEGIAVSKFEGVDMFNIDYDVQTRVEGIVAGDEALQTMGVRTFRNFLTSYVVLKPEHVYDRYTIDLKELAKSFGLKHPPAFNFARAPLSAAVKGIFHKPKKERINFLGAEKFTDAGSIFSVATGQDLEKKLAEVDKQKRLASQKKKKRSKKSKKVGGVQQDTKAKTGGKLEKQAIRSVDNSRKRILGSKINKNAAKSFKKGKHDNGRQTAKKQKFKSKKTAAKKVKLENGGPAEKSISAVATGQDLEKKIAEVDKQKSLASQKKKKKSKKSKKAGGVQDTKAKTGKKLENQAIKTEDNSHKRKLSSEENKHAAKSSKKFKLDNGKQTTKKQKFEGDEPAAKKIKSENGEPPVTVKLEN
ncbi:Helicase C-terminal [Trinorchestia longiramus]|nr:Helicase C-terminal [Trinorchestia longiramus]